MNLHLVDIHEEIVTAWREAFANFPEVMVQCSDILSVAQHCVVSPANSFGYMDGGIDAAYRAYFGAQIEFAVRDAISRRREGHLPVGASLIVRTGHQQVPYMIVAPTMSMPEAVHSRNCYRAMRAILRVAGEHLEVGRDVFCPGLGTGVGMVPPKEAAAMMAEAYRDWRKALTDQGGAGK